MELLREARTLSDAEMEQLVDAFADGWRALLPGGQLTQSQRAALRQLIGVLRDGASATTDPNAAVNRSLSRAIGTSNAIAAPSYPAEQVAVGRTLLLAALGKQSGKGPRPLPANAPTIPGYELCSVLGDGGFSVVYLARHLASGELRAVKVGRIVSQTRFRSEIRAITTLSGPHVVRYHEHGEMGEQFWIAMDYLGEHTLADLIASRPDAEQTMLLAAQLLRGLVALHRAGIIHRDLKPENAMVDTSFNLRLIDFGLSRAEETAVGVSATRTTGIVGTPRYNSPEQINEEGITTATDLWAFGCVLYELFTGTPLFAETRIIRLFDQIRNDPLPNLENSPIPPEIRPFLLRCLERDPAKRWPHAEQAERAFQEAMQPARRRLRHERYQPSWEKIFQTGLLERFAEQHFSLAPEQRLPRLVEMARNEGIEAIDEERLGEILPPLFEVRRLVMQTREELMQAKKRLAAELPSLSSADLVERTLQIEQVEHKLKSHAEAVKARAAELLYEERQRWEDKIRSAEETHRQREAERLRQQQEEQAQLEQKRREEAARQQRQRLEREARRRERAEWWKAFVAKWGISIGFGILTFLGFVALGVFLGAAAGGRWWIGYLPKDISAAVASVEAAWPIILIGSFIFTLTSLLSRGDDFYYFWWKRALVCMFGIVLIELIMMIYIAIFIKSINSTSIYLLSILNIIFLLSAIAIPIKLIFSLPAIIIKMNNSYCQSKKVANAIMFVSLLSPLIWCYALSLYCCAWILVLPSYLFGQNLENANEGMAVLGIVFGLWGLLFGPIVTLVHKANKS